ncbi:MAG TPA: hypothetical protein VE870_11185 [Bacteroidales bacterium]|nr:hypothetical protein [Bacteroidales bacterium]
MKEEYKMSMSLRVISAVLALLGLAVMVYGLITDPQRGWAVYLLNNFYFLSLSLGGVFFIVIQYISQSGWSSGFKRVPEAMMAYLPVAALFFILIYFGMHALYYWSRDGIAAADEAVSHKQIYLNIPFFYVRMIVFFALWIIFARIIRRFSLREDAAGGIEWFSKSEYYSRIYVFILAITFVFAAFDWIMSIDVHWYSTVFALKNMVSAFLHAVAIIVLIIFILNRDNYFGFLNKYHLHDFSRYLFMLSIIWGYLWFVQFMLIWYGNLPEETVYYYYRWQDGWKVLFFAEILLNWAIPFFVLLPVKASRNKALMLLVIVFLIVGQYVEQYLQIVPGVTGEMKFGLLEAGSFIGFAGLFVFIVFSAMARAKIVPVNHPYLGESVEHQF